MIVRAVGLLLTVISGGAGDRVSSDIQAADQALTSGRYALALELAQDAIDLDQKDYRAYERLAAAHIGLGDSSAAMAPLARAHQLALRNDRARIEQTVRGLLPLPFPVKRTNPWKAAIGRNPESYPTIVVGKRRIQIQEGDRHRAIPCSDILSVHRPREGRVVIATVTGDNLEFSDSYPGSGSADMAAAAAASACGIVLPVD